jgi:xylitol oxidase
VPDASSGLTNWAGNHRYRASELHRPRTLDELRRIAATARSLRVLGTRHTFSDIGDATSLVALDALADCDEIAIDADAATVTVGPAVTYAQLAQSLDAAGLGLANMASLPHISVAGAVATATHGSGDALGNLSTSVLGMELVTSSGELVRIAAGDPELPGAVVHLGALGVVTKLTLAVTAAYPLCQRVYVGMEWDALAENFDQIMGAGRSVSVFHRLGERVREVWVKADPQQPAPVELCGAALARAQRHPVPDADPVNCTVQLGVPGPWWQRLPHFQAGFTPSAGAEIQSEWFVAREQAMDALMALRQLADKLRPLILVCELRTVAADRLWLSPHHGRDSAGLHFTWRREPAAVAAACAEVQRALAPFAARPHWGKLFTTPATELTAHYPHLAEFAALRERLDGRRAFVNRWLERTLAV